MNVKNSNNAMIEDSTGKQMGSAWWRQGVLLILVICSILICYRETAYSILAIWMRSDTFAHGFLIIPIAAWLVWEKRFEIIPVHFEGAVFPLFLLVPVGIAWFVASLVDVLVVQQYAFVVMIILSIWAIVGANVARIIAFPLCFLLFAVPVGDGLIYPLMEFTTNFTVGMLKITGIPVYREGNFFSIPSGDWSVVEACSGFRYLIASVTLGTLYAYLTYNKLWKRVLFIAVSVVVPIIANGMRAYFIVMAAHLSDMKLAVGIDHLVYGWVFFGIIIALMFAIGNIWRDQQQEIREKGRSDGPVGKVRRLWLIGILAVCIGGAWPLLTISTADQSTVDVPVEIIVPEMVNGWALQKGNAWDWSPNLVGVDGEVSRFYKKDGTEVGLYLGVYRTQRQGAEQVSSLNQMAPRRHGGLWVNKSTSSKSLSIGQKSFKVKRHFLGSAGGERLLIWNWYRLGETHTGNDIYAKVLEALSRIVGSRTDAVSIAISASYLDDENEADIQLTDFIEDMLPVIDLALNQATDRKM